MRRLRNFLAATLAIALVATPAAQAEEGRATVAGPIAALDAPGALTRNYPFFASDRQLALRGYVEQEFFLSGSARPTSTPYASSVFADGVATGSPQPYRTRLLVRRPADGARFNGIVVVEWSNVSNGFEADNVWLLAQDHLIRAGYAWVGVSAKGFGGVEALRAWSPRRYGDLHIANGGRMTAEPLALDIFRQATHAVRTDPGGRLLGGKSAKILIGAGQSQGALWLTSYINGGWASDASLDGVLLLSATGAQLRPDTPLAVLRIVPEGDVRGGDAERRPSDGPRFRQWEIAGASHVDRALRRSREPVQLRDLGASVQANLAPQCLVPTIGTETPSNFVLAAAIDALARWVTAGSPPPLSPRLHRRTNDSGHLELERDADGLALGGIRLPDVAVPVGANVGMNSGAPGCQSQGYFQPYDIETLRRRYGSPQHYAQAVEENVQANVRGGFILRDDGDRIIADARQLTW